MRQVDQQDKTNEQEQTGAGHGKVVAPDDEERVRDEESQDDHENPAKNLRAPETVLDLCAAVLGRPDTDEHESHEDVEEAESKVDALHRDVAVALLAVALDVDIVQGELRELLHGPVGEHDPRDDRVDEEDERVCDTSSDAVSALSSTRAHDGAASGRATAGGGNAPYLAMLARAVLHVHVRLTVPIAGRARKGSDSAAPMVAMLRCCDVVGLVLWSDACRRAHEVELREVTFTWRGCFRLGSLSPMEPQPRTSPSWMLYDELGRIL